ncbi:hypothetical protein TrRE_jg11909 [Triparma retinervis]|uniref:CRAL-TRIO domain-containing protein n=1 Tax=Triparma retinervis TaxID=2557542 RepID=A0A9W7ADW0_9STRA|nr:hypothetical protein TrRE_jg11909 [Triparma retinervis]
MEGIMGNTQIISGDEGEGIQDLARFKGKRLEKALYKSRFGVLKIPQRYITGCMDDRREASRRWLATIAWRKQSSIAPMLSTEPCPNFVSIKRHYPHYYAGRGRSGATVYYEGCGGIDVPTLTGLGITVSDLCRHYVYMTEFCFRVLNSDREDARTITVFDVEGVGVGDVKGVVLEFIKETTAIMQAHYPERSQVRGDGREGGPKVKLESG